MITVEEARNIINEHIQAYGTEKVPVLESVGRVLREDLYADRDFPPYDRVTMDGIAIRFEDFAKGTRTFSIAGIAAAGAEQMMLEQENRCLEVMTGSVLPNGTDTVIRYEDLTITDGNATVILEQLNHQQNVHHKGSDRLVGSQIITSGRQLSPAEVGVAVTIGKAQLEVSRPPKTIIISTGDELVEVDEMPKPHQIRKSNVYRLRASFQQYGIEADAFHLQDDYAEIVRELARILAEYELVILSGGVSKGKFDYLPQALEELGVTKLFHKIKQRPGKPFWFGQSAAGTLVFALPGNPVSSFMCTQCYVLPWLHASMGLPKTSPIRAVLAEDHAFRPDLVYFLQVALSYDQEGRILAHPVTGNGSGDLANLVDADAFLELPRGRNQFMAGEVFP